MHYFVSIWYILASLFTQYSFISYIFPMARTIISCYVTMGDQTSVEKFWSVFRIHAVRLLTASMVTINITQSSSINGPSDPIVQSWSHSTSPSNPTDGLLPLNHTFVTLTDGKKNSSWVPLVTKHGFFSVVTAYIISITDRVWHKKKDALVNKGKFYFRCNSYTRGVTYFVTMSIMVQKPLCISQ